MTVAVSENYNSVCGVGFRQLLGCIQNSNYGLYTWADTYNSNTNIGSAAWNNTSDVAWYCAPNRPLGNGKYHIGRALIVWDTLLLPTDIAIQWAKIVGEARFDAVPSWEGFNCVPIMDVYYFTNALGASFTDCDIVEANFQYMRDCTTTLTGLIVTPAMTGYVGFEAPLNSAGLSAIVSGGYTKMAIKSASDTVSQPGAETYSSCQFKDIYLNIAYEDEGTLVVVTIPATNIASDAMTINGEITQGIATTRGFDWGISDCANPDAADLTSNWTEGGSFGAGAYSHDISGLTPGSCYCHRAKAEE